MAETSPIFRRDEVQKLLRALKDDKVKVIEPTFSYEKGVEYPALSEITGASAEALESILAELSKVECLTSEVVNNVAVCPTCRSHQLTVRMHCPTCGSSKLVKGSMIEHLLCSYLDMEEAFRKGELLACPKCGRALKAIGVDYRRPGVMYRCSSCGGMFPNPKRRYMCSGGHAFDEDELAIREIRAYKLNPAKRLFVERETIDFKSLMEEMAAMGELGQAPATVTGKSGVEHEFAFALWDSGGNTAQRTPEVVADLHVSGEALDPMLVLAFFAKGMDVGSKVKILMTMPGLDKAGKLLVKSYNVHVVEAETAAELKGKVKDLLQMITKEKEKERLKAEAEALEEVLKVIEGK